ncbi:MAG: type VII secretion target, partial [Actinomycetia bacterium]|nr:type VII secretion target [Actinomycetes bacterium]
GGGGGTSVEVRLGDLTQGAARYDEFATTAGDIASRLGTLASPSGDWGVFEAAKAGLSAAATALQTLFTELQSTDSQLAGRLRGAAGTYQQTESDNVAAGTIQT